MSEEEWPQPYRCNALFSSSPVPAAHLVVSEFMKYGAVAFCGNGSFASTLANLNIELNKSPMASIFQQWIDKKQQDIMELSRSSNDNVVVGLCIESLLTFMAEANGTAIGGGTGNGSSLRSDSGLSHVSEQKATQKKRPPSMMMRRKQSPS